MRKRVFIHIGPPKTGSTSIQSVLETNYNALHARGVEYPRLGGGGDHNNLWLLFNPGGEIGQFAPRRLRKPSDARHVRARIEADLRANISKCSNVVFSSEAFFDYPPEAVSQFRNLLAEEGFSRAHIVCVYRDLASSYLSTAASWIGVSSRLPRLAQIRHYWNTLPFWAQRPGTSVTTLRLHKAGKPSALLRDFEAEMRAYFERDIDLIVNPDAALSNRSPGAEAIVALQSVNAGLETEGDMSFARAASRVARRAIVEADHRMKGRATLAELRPEIALAIRQEERRRYSSDLAAMGMPEVAVDELCATGADFDVDSLGLSLSRYADLVAYYEPSLAEEYMEIARTRIDRLRSKRTSVRGRLKTRIRTIRLKLRDPSCYDKIID